MEIALRIQDLEPLPKPRRETFKFKNEGLLNSSYKEATSKNFFHSSPKSVFGAKQRIKSRRFQTTSTIETVLKLSVFVSVFMIIFS